MIFGYLYYRFNDRVGIAEIQNIILSYGYISVLVFILIFTLRTLVVFAPYYIMVIIGGNLFGPYRGTLYTLIAVIISSSLAFFISRKAGAFFLKKGKTSEKYVAVIERHGFKILMFMRFSLVFPYDVINYAAGLTTLSYKHFLVANLVGLMPEILLLTLFGEHLNNPFTASFKIVSLILVILVFCLVVFKKSIKSQVQKLLN